MPIEYFLIGMGVRKKWVEEQKAQGVEFDENITEQKRILVITIGKISKNNTIKKNIIFSTKHLGSTADDEEVKLKQNKYSYTLEKNYINVDSYDEAKKYDFNNFRYY
jgi:hypothetical protein